MDLFENPFYLLEVTTRDSSQKIVLTAEEKSLAIDTDVCTKACSILTNPRQRLSAEISWLPGLSPGKVDEIIKNISTSPIQGINDLLIGLPHLAYCNLATSYINQLSFKDNPEYLVKWISYIVNAFQYIDYDLLLNFINEDRTVARFPLVQNKEDIEQELYNHKDYLTKIFKTALAKIPDPDIHLTEILKQSIQSHAALPLLLDDLTELYHIEVQRYLDQLADEAGQLISSLKDDLSVANGVLPTLYKRIGKLEETLKAWKQIAEPINLVMHNRGSQDEHSAGLADQVRDLAIFLANEYDLHAEARLIICLMGEVFEKLPQVFDKINEDLNKLDDILSEREKEKEKEQPENVRLIGEMLRKLSQGEKLIFGDILVEKNGIMLNKPAHYHKGRRSVFGLEPYYAKWEELSISSQPGIFIIESTKEKKARVELSYQDMDDVHILEAVMRFLWKDGNYIKLQQGLFS